MEFCIAAMVRCSLLLQLLVLLGALTGPAKSSSQCAKWGNTFDVSLESDNVRRDCNLPDGRPICCAALMNHTSAAIVASSITATAAVGSSTLQRLESGFFGVPMGEKGVGLSYHPPQKPSRSAATAVATAAMGGSSSGRAVRTSCHIHKQYISSPLEQQDLAVTRSIESKPKQPADVYADSSRLQQLLDYVTSSEVTANATRWLQRVAVHMQSPVPVVTADDYAFLSRFEVTRMCTGEATAESWTEWIEPITITARHPFGFGQCWRVVGSHYKKHDGKPRVGRSNVDYVLLQSGAALYNQTHTATGRRIHHTTFSYGDADQTFSSSGSISNSGSSIGSSSSSSGSGSTSISSNTNSNSRKEVNPRLERWQQRVQANSGPPKHFMFDAGTSTFDSSLFWFTCGYSQRRVAFDQVFGWEMTLLEPRDYWRRVPANWKPYWHFHNVPVSADLSDADSPLRYALQIASERDFVAFKLDIDHPAMEMPMAMQLLQDPAVFTLIDEFFFELHFRCEVMTSCGWGKAVPTQSHGLLLDRSHVLQYFVDLRKRGIRAHIWP